MEGKSSDKPLALITGASSGVGYEIAKQFAQNSYDLVIVSENPAVVEAAQACRSIGANVESFVIDLSESSGVEELKAKMLGMGRAVDALAINSGIGNREVSKYGIDEELALINLNIVSSVQLTRHFIKGMLKHRRGKILFTSSVEGKMPTSLQAVYRASKSFIQTYADTVRLELQGSGITVTEIVPYASENHFAQSAEEVASHGFQYMMSGEGHVEAGINKFKSEEGKAAPARSFGDPSKLKH